MKRPLPPVHVGPELHAELRAQASSLLDACRRTTADGLAVFLSHAPGDGAPAGSDRLVYTRDIAAIARYAGNLAAPDEVLGCIDLILAHQRDDGSVPDSVSLDGVPSFYIPHAGPEPSHVPLDNAPLIVLALYAHFARTRDYAAFVSRREACYRALESMPLSDDGLAYVDANRPFPAHGYADAVAMTGKVLFCSLLYWEACNTLAYMLRQSEYHDEAHDWYEVSERAGAYLGQFFDPRFGIFRAASESCNQIDLWGSAYACVNRAASKTQADQVADFLLSAHSACFYEGHMRHLPFGENWRRLRTPIRPETSQNGAYWALPTGWAAQAINAIDEQRAVSLVADCLARWRAEGVYQYIGRQTQPGGPGHLASVLNLLGACVR